MVTNLSVCLLWLLCTVCVYTYVFADAGGSYTYVLYVYIMYLQMLGALMYCMCIYVFADAGGSYVLYVYVFADAGG